MWKEFDDFQGTFGKGRTFEEKKKLFEREFQNYNKYPGDIRKSQIVENV